MPASCGTVWLFNDPPAQEADMSGPRMDPRDYTLQLRAAIRRYLPWRGLALIDTGRWSDRLLVTAALLMVNLPSLTVTT